MVPTRRACHIAAERCPCAADLRRRGRKLVRLRQVDEYVLVRCWPGSGHTAMPRCLPGGHAARPWRGARECPAPAPLRTLQTNQLTPRSTNTEGTPPNLPSRDRSHGARGGSQACDRPASFRHRELSQCDRGIFQGCRGWLPAKLAPLLATTAACEMFIVGVQGLAPATTAGDYGWRASQGDKALQRRSSGISVRSVRSLHGLPSQKARQWLRAVVRY